MLSKSEVGYEHPAQGPNHCADCIHFEVKRPNGCEIVSGLIMPEDWCRKFSMKRCNHKGECFGACGVQKSPAEMAHGQKAVPHTSGSTKEHDTIVSKTTGKTHEISLGPNSGGLVPANPFASLAQAGYMHSHPGILGKKGLDEWDSATKGKHLPEHVKKSK